MTAVTSSCDVSSHPHKEACRAKTNVPRAESENTQTSNQTALSFRLSSYHNLTGQFLKEYVFCHFLGKREVKCETLCSYAGSKKYMPLESFHLFHFRTTVSLMLLVDMVTMAGCEYPGNIYEKVVHCFIDHKIMCHSSSTFTHPHVISQL